MARAPLRAGDPVQAGRYRLIARLGSGGMGVVYLGVDPAVPDGGPVAVKVLRPELADDLDFRRRFRHEVSALMRVKGVCTVRVIEADTEAERPFMVTEYAEGPSLSEYINSYGALGSGMLYGLATGLAEALTVIHAAGIVHRDLKPSNVILTDAGPKVIDFGIARALDATSVTRTGMMVGSAGFMAPEQISGHPGLAADIFVWGVTVAYAATGRPPFGAGATDAVLYRVMYADPDITGTPGPLRPLVEAALAKDPQARPTARELLDRLASASPRSYGVADAPTEAVLARTWPQTGPHSGRPGLARENGKHASVLLGPVPAGAAAPRHPPGRAARRRRKPPRQGTRRVSCGDRGRCHRRDRRGGDRSYPEDRGARGERGKPRSARPQCPGYPAQVSRAAAARRLPDDLPHRRRGEHDGDHGLAGRRRRCPPAVLRII